MSDINDTPDFDLNLHIHRLLTNEPFFASLSRRMNKTPSKAIPTAGVMVTDDGKLEMVYNPSFFAGLKNDEERLDILKHEFYHIVLRHVTGSRFGRFKDMTPSERKIHNIGMDLAINCNLPNIPDMACVPGQGPFAHMPGQKSAEWYIRELRKMQNDPPPEGGDSGDGEGGDSGDSEGGEPGGNGNGQGGGNPLDDIDSHDDHSGWDNVSDDIKQMAEERVKEYIEDAVGEAQKSGRGWGTVPGSIQKEIIASLKSVIDWKKALRYFVKQSQKANKRSTVRRINKRYPYQHPGKKSTRTAKIAIAIDQSGSVSDQMLSAFFGELNALSKIAEFTVVPFDTRVDDSKVYEWKKGQSRPPERVMCGGTDFNAPTKWVNEKGGFDGLIICTDMEAPKPVSCKVQRMWITDEYNAQRPYFNPKPERMLEVPLK